MIAPLKRESVKKRPSASTGDPVTRRFFYLNLLRPGESVSLRLFQVITMHLLGSPRHICRAHGQKRNCRRGAGERGIFGCYRAMRTAFANHSPAQGMRSASAPSAVPSQTIFS